MSSESRDVVNALYAVTVSAPAALAVVPDMVGEKSHWVDYIVSFLADFLGGWYRCTSLVTLAIAQFHICLKKLMAGAQSLPTFPSVLLSSKLANFEVALTLG
ncbi:hypothetical protein C8Q69DRAFT_530080 [Paecilomyces variotii]|uniref:Uncharacterized protein n=1 Tax=Byssochlamys spectabilis TaxID=264951 RepID=A0A443HM39_BYSSP|nr:hypothetical protein C8Q69DRAFT_530080 [Paecilomyces variotii]RWQ92884.1 hypothetical protein C8Q69DRAFT_530080 [Paecilomyces variotii]